MPAHLRRAEEDELVADLVARAWARATAGDVPPGPPPTTARRATRGPVGPRGDVLLVARADAVAARWLPGTVARRVAWSHRMQRRWASCTPATAHVRVSHRLADAPDAVLDSILLHELAHLHEAGHGPAFRALVAVDPSSAAATAWLAHRSRHELRVAVGLA